MSSKVKIDDKSLAIIDFEVSAEDFTKALETVFNRHRKKFQIPGFRPGKAPMNLVMKYYGEGVLYEEAIEECANKAYSEAVEEHDLDPVSHPEIDEIHEIGQDKGLKFSLKVTVKPQVTLGEYKTLDVSKDSVRITAKEVDAELDKLRERNSRMVPVEDRPVLEGDTANIDYEGFLDDVPFDGGKGASYDLRIGSKTFIPGFEEQVIGREVGEEFDVNVTFPEEYHSEDLKGKDVVFKVKVNSVKMQELPELDDEFAKDVSEFDTLEEYKNSIKDKLRDEAKEKADNDFDFKLRDMVVQNATVEIPEVMVEHEVDMMVQEQASGLRYQGLELEQYLQYIGQDMNSFREGMQEQAASKVKTNLVMEALGKELAFEVTDEEIEAQIEKIAEQYGMPADDIRNRFGTEDSFLKESIIHDKTMDYLRAENPPVAKSKSKSKPKAKAKAKEKTEDKGE